MNKPPVDSDPTEPGLFRLTIPGHGGRFSLYVPPEYSARETIPLVIALHYQGPPTPYFGLGVLDGLVGPAFAELGALIAAPDCRSGDWANPQSEADVVALLDHLQAAYRVDRARCALVGYSMGGIGAWYVAARQQDRFAAAMPLAARPPQDVLQFKWRIPLYIINSRQDQIFPLEPTERAVVDLRARGARVHLRVLEDVGHFQVDRYVFPLREAVVWLAAAWSDRAAKS